MTLDGKKVTGGVAQDLPGLDMIDTLLLDMDGTLLDLHFDNHFWVDHLPLRYSDLHEVAFESANDHVEQSLREAEGTLSWYCINHWSEHFKVDIMKLKDEITHLIQYREGSAEFLRRVEAVDHLQVLLITDAHPAVLDLKQLHTSLLDHVEQAISSHDLGAPKRHPLFWKRLAEVVSFDPARTLMIDDNPHVLAQCQAFGVHHLLCVDQPDSRKRREHDHAFPVIDNLMHLFESGPVSGQDTVS